LVFSFGTYAYSADEPLCKEDTGSINEKRIKNKRIIVEAKSREYVLFSFFIYFLASLCNTWISNLI